MEVMTSSPAAEFNFDSACTSPYITAPSSPTRFGSPFFSAPTSPTRASTFYNAYTTSLHGGINSLSSIPFNWEENLGTPKNTHNHNDDETIDFAFDFSGELERKSLPADELFHGGKIKLLKPPPRFQYENKPVTSRSSSKKSFKETFSPRCKKKDHDPFEAAIEISRADDKIRTIRDTLQEANKNHDQERGRERNPMSSNPVKGHKSTRSLSPLRASDLVFDEPQKPNKTSSSSSWYKNWKIKDLLLFRSASEGHDTGKYGAIKKKSIDSHEDDSFRSTDSFGSSVSSSRRRSISAHEMHYTINRAVSEEMKKKTYLPYKQGLLGCLGFNPAVNEISKGIGSMRGG